MESTDQRGDGDLSWTDAMGLDQSEDRISEWSFSVSIMIAAWRMGTERKVTQRDEASCSCMNMGQRLVGFMLV